MPILASILSEIDPETYAAPIAPKPAPSRPQKPYQDTYGLERKYDNLRHLRLHPSATINEVEAFKTAIHDHSLTAFDIAWRAQERHTGRKKPAPKTNDKVASGRITKPQSRGSKFDYVKPKWDKVMYPWMATPNKEEKEEEDEDEDEAWVTAEEVRAAKELKRDTYRLPAWGY